MKKLGGLVLVFLIVTGLVAGSRLMRLENPSAISSEQKKAVYLSARTDLAHLESLLVDSLGVAADKQELHWAATMLGWKTFQPGHYLVEGGTTYDAFLSKLARGIQDPVRLTIIPGQSVEAISAFLATKLQFDSLAIRNTLRDTTFLKEQGFEPRSLIGHLFPSGYELYWTSPPQKILNRIFKEFNEQAQKPHRQRMQELDMRMNEVLALASIVEWEASQDDEMPTISGLYWNRLNRGMLLQADPTVNYAVDKRRRLYFKDYKVDHPYNTYVHKGLPPGPITNPSLAAIKAALYPEKHDYIYMVAKPDGYHQFSTTYEEHQRKSREWREYLRSQEKR